MSFHVVFPWFSLKQHRCVLVISHISLNSWNEPSKWIFKNVDWKNPSLETIWPGNHLGAIIIPSFSLSLLLYFSLWYFFSLILHWTKKSPFVPRAHWLFVSSILFYLLISFSLSPLLPNETSPLSHRLTWSKCTSQETQKKNELFARKWKSKNKNSKMTIMIQIKKKKRYSIVEMNFIFLAIKY